MESVYAKRLFPSRFPEFEKEFQNVFAPAGARRETNAASARPYDRGSAMRRNWLINLSCICLFGLCGCSAINVKLGRRVDLTKTPVISIEVSLAKSPGIAPGQKLALVATATQPAGKLLLTEGQGKGKIQWKDLKVTTSIVTADQKGNISLSKDPRVSDGKVG